MPPQGALSVGKGSGWPLDCEGSFPSRSRGTDSVTPPPRAVRTPSLRRHETCAGKGIVLAPVALGQPTREFPWPWSVQSWLRGQDLGDVALDWPIEAARTLASFMTALHVPEPDGPVLGDHNFYRGCHLAERASISGDLEAHRCRGVGGPGKIQGHLRDGDASFSRQLDWREPVLGPKSHQG